MDQRIVAGIGNIYAAEILFRAKVRPTRRAGRVTRSEIEKIAAAVPLILRAAIGPQRHHLSQLSRFACDSRAAFAEGACACTGARANRATHARRRSERGRRRTRQLLLSEMPALIGVVAPRRNYFRMLRLKLRQNFLAISCFAIAIAALVFIVPASHADSAPQIDWNKVDSEALDYFRAYLRFDTTNPPGNTAAAIAYLKRFSTRKELRPRPSRASPGWSPWSRASPDPRARNL